jgi:hypothetical protein
MPARPHQNNSTLKPILKRKPQKASSFFSRSDGEHNIAVKKTGYKAWEKSIKLTAGETKLNAELEPDGSK